MENSSTLNNSSRDLVRPIFRHKLIIFISCLLISSGTYVALLFKTNVYEAKVLIHIKGIGPIEAQTYERLGPYRIHFTQMAIVTSNPVIERTIKALRLYDKPLDYEAKYCHPLKVPFVKWYAKKMQKTIDSLSLDMKQRYLLSSTTRQLKENIITTLRPTSDIFEISVYDFDPVKAIEIANVLSRSYVINDLEQQLVEMNMKYGALHPSIQQVRDNINKMKRDLNGKEITNMDAFGTATVKIIEQASSSYEPVGKPKALMFLIGIIISAVVGVALAFIFDLYGNNFKSPNDFVKYLNIPVIGTVPKQIFFKKNIIGKGKSFTLYESFMSDLADQIFIFMKVQKLQTLIFVSVSPNSVNSAITSNLGFHLSGLGCNVLVIDANIASPIISKQIQLDKVPGLVDIMNGKSRKINNVIYNKDTISFIPVGTPQQDTAGLIDKTNIMKILDYCRKKFDAVLIDCTLVSKMSDMGIISLNSDGVVIIANEGKDNIQVTQNIMNMFRNYNAMIIGGILNNRTFPIPKWLYKRI